MKLSHLFFALSTISCQPPLPHNPHSVECSQHSIKQQIQKLCQQNPDQNYQLILLRGIRPHNGIHHAQHYQAINIPCSNTITLPPNISNQDLCIIQQTKTTTAPK